MTMSRAQANVWGRVLLRNKLITQDKWDFVIGEYFDQGAEGTIGQWLVDAGYINVKQMQQIAGVVGKVVSKSQPSETKAKEGDKLAPVSIPEMDAEPEPDSEPVIQLQPEAEPDSDPEPVPESAPVESADDSDFIDLEPERDDDAKIEITDMSELRTKVSAEAVSPSGIEASTKLKPRESSAIDTNENASDEDDDQYGLAGSVPTDEEALGMRVSEVDWNSGEGDDKSEPEPDFQIDDSERISLDGDD
jgi:hypothetical protein